MAGKNTSAGLRGQSAGETAVCTVGAEGNSLRYRGYDVEELAEKSTFNEVAYMILKGHLPLRRELDDYAALLKTKRGLSAAMKEVLERIPADAHPMDVLRSACSFLGNTEPEQDFSQQDDKADRLLAAFPSMLCYWYRYSHDGVRIETETDDDSIGADSRMHCRRRRQQPALPGLRCRGVGGAFDFLRSRPHDSQGPFAGPPGTR